MIPRTKMEDFLKIKLVPSLQHIAAAKICITHYIHEEQVIKFLISQTGYRKVDQKQWHVQKDLVRRSISSLNFPKLLKAMILNFIDDIDNELLKWVKVNYWFGQRAEAVHYIEKCLVWTSRGTIHYEKTAQKILRSECITHEEKFHLTCQYCFFDILENCFFSELEKYRSLDKSELSKNPFVFYCVCHFFPEMTQAFLESVGIVRRNWSIDEIMLVEFFEKMNCVAVKYFYNRIDLVVKENVIRLLLPVFDFDVQTYLISLSSSGTRERIVGNPSTLLKSVTNVLWLDYVYFYFCTYERFITSHECLEFLKNVLIPGAGERQWKKALVCELWNGLSKNFRQDIVFECLEPVTGGRLYEELIFQILSILVDFNNDKNSPYYGCSGCLIDEILRVIP